ncbi:hypothetical protein Salat_2439500 [Sesamum alatum]|uniref:DUF4283 domain-containing protein n=1 Tax=Sesamum alatum TaxID=300844 RepID=A0AAE1XYF8_9LAMI|nr:hypothetical protein Salat_2439500 [Sesamum alatum]
MDQSVERLAMDLRLMEDEDEGLHISSSTWRGGGSEEVLWLVGRLLTPRQYRYGVLTNTLQFLIRLARGMEVRSLEANRFLLTFQHVVDRDRALGGCPWMFDKNLVILSKVTTDENPMEV